jgi:hypothetical protein
MFDFDNRHPLRGSWNESRLLMGKRLTDRRIGQYQKRGYYTEAFRQARRELMERKRGNRIQREGNFVEQNGRMIYSPL